MNASGITYRSKRAHRITDIGSTDHRVGSTDHGDLLRRVFEEMRTEGAAQARKKLKSDQEELDSKALRGGSATTDSEPATGVPNTADSKSLFEVSNRRPYITPSATNSKSLTAIWIVLGGLQSNSLLNGQRALPKTKLRSTCLIWNQFCGTCDIEIGV